MKGLEVRIHEILGGMDYEIKRTIYEPIARKDS